MATQVATPGNSGKPRDALVRMLVERNGRAAETMPGHDCGKSTVEETHRLATEVIERAESRLQRGVALVLSQADGAIQQMIDTARGTTADIEESARGRVEESLAELEATTRAQVMDEFEAVRVLLTRVHGLLSGLESVVGTLAELDRHGGSGSRIDVEEPVVQRNRGSESNGHSPHPARP